MNDFRVTSELMYAKIFFSDFDPHLQYVLNKPGAPLKLYVNGYPYFKHDIQNERTYWRCFKSNKTER